MQRICEEKLRLSRLIQDLEMKISQLPNGKLICTNHQGYIRWYVSDGHSKTYIKKKNRPFAEQLALKKLLKQQQQELLQEQVSLDMYLRHHQVLDENHEHFLASLPSFQSLLKPLFPESPESLLSWLNEPFESNPRFSDQLIHRSINGIMVRSKSESLIASALYRANIPFRYECLLVLDGHSFYPDFTILHPKTHEIYYYEHFGMMDQSAYASQACSKIQLYAMHDIIPGVNLLTTYETLEHPLDSELVERMIEFYFL